MSERRMSGAVVVSALGGVMNILFGLFLVAEVLPALLGEDLNTTVFALAEISGLILLVGSWLVYSSPERKRTGGQLVILGAIIGALNPLSLILGLIAGWGTLREAPAPK